VYVIGISSGIKHGHHDGAAVLLKDGQLIAAAEEERFTLSKHARGELPRGAIDFCLKQAGISIKDVDWICSPLKTYTNYERRLTEYFKFSSATVRRSNCMTTTSAMPRAAITDLDFPKRR
jgi:carbamoyltransferase